MERLKATLLWCAGSKSSLARNMSFLGILSILASNNNTCVCSTKSPSDRSLPLCTYQPPSHLELETTSNTTCDREPRTWRRGANMHSCHSSNYNKHEHRHHRSMHLEWTKLYLHSLRPQTTGFAFLLQLIFAPVKDYIPIGNSRILIRPGGAPVRSCYKLMPADCSQQLCNQAITLDILPGTRTRPEESGRVEVRLPALRLIPNLKQETGKRVVSVSSSCQE